MSFSASELGLRVYLEGIQIPVVSATITFQDGEPATAQINTLPSAGFQKITPRSMIHIFYLLEATKKDSSDFFVHKDPKIPVTNEESFGREYKLLFSGEYVGYNYTKSTQGRALMLNCIDATNYFAAIKQGASNYSTGGFEQVEQAFLGAQRDKNAKTFYGKDLTENFTTWLGGTKHYEYKSDTPTKFDPNPSTNTAANTDQDNSFGSWKKTQDTNVITGIHRAIQTSFCNNNIFYAQQLVRHRLNDKIVGLRGDITGDKLFDINVFKKWVKQKVGGGKGQYKSLSEVLQQVMSIMLFNITTIPSPKMLRGYAEGELYKPYNDWVSLKNEGTKGGVGNFVPGTQREYDMGTALNQYLVKPDFWYFPPPACNIIFPDQYTNFSYGRDFISEPTRMIMRTQTMIQGGGIKTTPKVTYGDRTLGGAPAVATTNVTGGNGGVTHLTERTYAPDFSAFKALLKGGAGYKAQLYRVLLPHERFVGPNTIFTWEGDMGGFGSKSSRKQYFRIFTDYLFWKIYYSTRSGSLEMPFSPQVVPGFSAVILDEFSDINGEDSPYKFGEGYNPKGKFGMHHCAFVTAVVHEIGQSGATTRLQLTAVRHFEEDVDFDAIQDSKESKPFDDVVVRPLRDYLDPRYYSENIGTEFYYPIIGCKSIIEIVNYSNSSPSGYIHPGESTTTGGTLSIKDCIKRLEYMYRFNFVDADKHDKNVLNQVTVGRGDAGSTITHSKRQSKQKFITQITERLGLPGEIDILGKHMYAYNLWREYLLGNSGIYGKPSSLELDVLKTLKATNDTFSDPATLVKAIKNILNGNTPLWYQSSNNDAKGVTTNTGTTTAINSGNIGSTNGNTQTTVSVPGTNAVSRQHTGFNKVNSSNNIKTR